MLGLVPSMALAMALAGGLGSYMALPTSVVETLASRGYQSATPIQAAALTRVYSGESLMLHAETGSGKTLAMLLPALCRTAPDAGVLILSPTRELAVQLGHEAGALLEATGDGGAVCLVAQGHPATAAELTSARVVVATPTEYCQLLAGEAAGQLAEALGARVGCLVLDEVDALIPGQKAFRGKRHSKWMDVDMHPAEAIVRMLARRTSRPDFQLLAASATLDKSTRRKVVRQLRACNNLVRRAGAAGLLPVVSTVTKARTPPKDLLANVEDEDEDEDEDDEDDEEEDEDDEFTPAAGWVVEEEGEGAVDEIEDDFDFGELASSSAAAGDPERQSRAARIAALIAATEAAERRTERRAVTGTLTEEEEEAEYEALGGEEAALLEGYEDEEDEQEEGEGWVAEEDVVDEIEDDFDFGELASSAAAAGDPERQSRAARIAALIAATEAAERRIGAATAGEKFTVAGTRNVERWTAVPPGIEHYTLSIRRDAFDGSDGTAAAAKTAAAVYARRAHAGSTLIFVSSRSTYLGGAHQVVRTLRALGLAADHLSDALWPSSTRAKKRSGPRRGAVAGGGGRGGGRGRGRGRGGGGRAAAVGQADGGRVRMSLDEGDEIGEIGEIGEVGEVGEVEVEGEAASRAKAGGGAIAGLAATRRRAELNSELRGGTRRLLVADAAATRGLHLDNVGTVIVLGLPANADTYLHLAGRTGRWPRTEAPGSAVAVTIATEPELRTLRGWSAGLGGVDFRDAAEDVSAVPEGARAE